MSVFLSCTVIGMIPRGVANVTRMTAGKELYQLSSIRRLQPLVKGDNNSSCVLTLVSDEEMPRGRMVLSETYGQIMEKLKTVVL